MPGLSRRGFLLGAAAASGAAAGSQLLPISLQRALAATPEEQLQSLAQIEHVVLLMQENRSFDHYFGSLAGVRGFSDPAALQLSTGKPVFYQPDPQNPDGYELPFHLDTTTTSSAEQPSLSHSWGPQHNSWNGGAMDNWLPAHRASDGANGPLTMGYLTRSDLPVHYALADAFTICDAYHCSVLGPTWPNRLYFMSATLDPDGLNNGPIIGDSISTPLTWQTYPEALQAAGVSWRVYEEPNNDGNNMLEHFASFINAPTSSPLHKYGLTPGPHAAFAEDVRRGALPQVSWILPPTLSIEHPDQTPGAGAQFIYDIVDALASVPDVWAKTVLFVTWDENDGLFDHVPPPTSPEGTAGEWLTGTLPSGAGGIAGPVGLGFRVPMLVISPWSRGGWVSSDVFDHTSMLRFVETRFGVEVPNLSAWRRQTVGDLTTTLQGAPQNSPNFILPNPEFPARLGQLAVATQPKWSVPKVQQMPRQETARAALDLDAEPQFVAAGGQTLVTVTLRNGGVSAQQPAELSQLRFTATAPAGWSVDAARPAIPRVLPVGGEAKAAWRVSAPAQATAGTMVPITVAASYLAQTGQQTAPGTVQAQVPVSVPMTLAQAFNNTGISDDASRRASFDGMGNSFSLQALAAAGLTPGATFTYDGLTFTWPDVPAGQPDNVIVTGQMISMSGTGTTLGFVGASTPAKAGSRAGEGGGDGTIFYTDGSTSSYWITLDNFWYPPDESQVVASMPYLNSSGSMLSRTAYLYYMGVPLLPGKTVQAITLPSTSMAPQTGSNRGVHLFAVAVGGS